MGVTPGWHASWRTVWLLNARKARGRRAVLFVMDAGRVEASVGQGREAGEDVHGVSAPYLAVDGELVGAIGIEDALWEGTHEAVRDVRAHGLSHLAMLTGDNKAPVGRVVMAGDGVGDSPVCLRGPGQGLSNRLDGSLWEIMPWDSGPWRV